MVIVGPHNKETESTTETRHKKIGRNRTSIKKEYLHRIQQNHKKEISKKNIHKNLLF